MTYIFKQATAVAVAFSAISPTASLISAQTRTAAPFTWQGRLAPGATVEVKGVNGPVRVIATPGTTGRVEAVRTGRRNDPSEVEIVVLEHADGVTICAIHPSTLLQRNECAPGSAGRVGARNSDVQVAFSIEVPPYVNLFARTQNGSVSAENLTGRVEVTSTNGDVRIEGGSAAHARTTNGSITVNTRGAADVRTTNGRITASLQSLDGSSPLRFSTTNGSITLALPVNANAAIDARTTNGAIDTDFPITVQGRLQRNQITGILGSGGQQIEVRTTNGRIRLERSP